MYPRLCLFITRNNPETQLFCSMTDQFWQNKSLAEMSAQEWEALCDGCGQCCLLKLEDEDDGSIYTTRLACQMLDLETCRCTDYKNRHKLMPDCVAITPENTGSLSWLPPTCAYRLIHEGKDLEWWHPLISGDPETVHNAGVSVRNSAVGEQGVEEDDYERFITGVVPKR